MLQHMSKSVFGQLVSRIGIVMAALIAASVLPVGASAQSLTPNLPPAKYVLSVGGEQIAFAQLSIQTGQISQPTPFPKEPPPPTPPSVTLTGGSGRAGLLYLSNWHQQVINGSLLTVRQNADLLIYSNNTIIIRYHLTNAWPTKLTINAPTAGSSALSYDVKLVADSITAVAL
jgi:hypothetical protein